MNEGKNNQMPTVQYGTGQYPIMRDDDIDLKELILGLWAERWLIASIATLITVVSLVYALRATPYYKTETTLYTASDAQLEKINSLELIKVTKESNAEFVYSSLRSTQKLREFFFLNPDLFNFYIDKSENVDKAFSAFMKNGIQVSLPDAKKDQGKGIFLDISTVLPESIDGEKFLTNYTRFVLMEEQAELSKSLTDLVTVMIQRHEKSIEAILLELEEKRINKISLLKEAREIAARLKIAEPISIATLSNTKGAGQGVSLVTNAGARDNALYLYGTRFLDAEIASLENRKKEEIADNRIPELRGEIARLKALDTKVLQLTGNAEDIYLARVASKPYRSLEKVKPKRAFICIIGAIFGGMLGVFIALIKRMFRD